MEDKYAFIDFQGFKDNSNRFIVKEFALITKNIIFHDTIKSPPNITLDESHERQAKWLTENYHGLEWTCGQISFTKLRNTIQPILQNKTVFLKGFEKVEWLQYILGINNKKNVAKRINIVDLESLNCSISLHKKDIDKQNKFYACENHRSIKHKKNEMRHCAMENVLILTDWYMKNAKE